MKLMHRGMGRSGWRFTLILVNMPYLGIWLFLLFIVRPFEQPWLTAAIAWLVFVKAAFVLVITGHLNIPETARVLTLPSRQVAALGIGFIIAAIVFGCSALAGEGTVSVVGVLYVFLGIVFLLMAQAAKIGTF